ncbi:hypothetical protein ABZZ20_36725, partial [Streptomyces sp. NPDC006430]|uniref:hypothetical protein n=1 Tax=Streptomyces sp. NPDC006430 TaxID=3154299 RepID=UPI0033B2FBD9
ESSSSGGGGAARQPLGTGNEMLGAGRAGLTSADVDAAVNAGRSRSGPAAGGVVVPGQAAGMSEVAPALPWEPGTDLDVDPALDLDLGLYLDPVPELDRDPVLDLDLYLDSDPVPDLALVLDLDLDLDPVPVPVPDLDLDLDPVLDLDLDPVPDLDLELDPEPEPEPEPDLGRGGGVEGPNALGSGGRAAGSSGGESVSSMGVSGGGLSGGAVMPRAEVTPDGVARGAKRRRVGDGGLPVVEAPGDLADAASRRGLEASTAEERPINELELLRLRQPGESFDAEAWVLQRSAAQRVEARSGAAAPAVDDRLGRPGQPLSLPGESVRPAEAAGDPQAVDVRFEEESTLGQGGTGLDELLDSPAVLDARVRRDHVEGLPWSASAAVTWALAPGTEVSLGDALGREDRAIVLRGHPELFPAEVREILDRMIGEEEGGSLPA